MYATIHSSSAKNKITRMNEIIKIKEISKQKEGATRERERWEGERKSVARIIRSGERELTITSASEDMQHLTGKGICSNYWRAMYATTLNNLYGMDK